jgi:outer membrane protein OmpA-like peptidoglycan-associated protein
MSKGCKCKSTECEECPEWIFTFADLVMLMMGFFVILWVLKPAGGKPATAEADEKWLEVVAKIREAFNYLPDPTSKDPVDMHILMKKIEEMDPLKGKGDGGETKRKQHGAPGTDPETQTVRPGKQAIIGTRVQFQAGKAELSAEGKSALDEIVKLIQGHRQIFIVKGHTSSDDFASATAKVERKQLAQDQMNLSVRRAQVVADYLTSSGVEPEVLRVQGCSTFEPIVQRAYSEDANVKNRRTEVESSDSAVSERQDTAKTTHILPPELRIESATTSTDSIEPK